MVFNGSGDPLPRVYIFVDVISSTIIGRFAHKHRATATLVFHGQEEAAQGCCTPPQQETRSVDKHGGEDWQAEKLRLAHVLSAAQGK